MIIIIFVFGAIIGSFLNMLIWRLPREESILGRSHCVSCGRTLDGWDLFPLLSYLFLRGKCRKCKAKIPFRYFLVELIAGALFVLAWHFRQPGDLASVALLLRDWTVIAAFIVTFAVDWEHFLILDNVIFPAAAAVALFNLASGLLGGNWLDLSGQFFSGVIGAVLAPLPFFLLWYLSKGRWMGFGDVKLAILLGMALGWSLAYVGIMIAVFLGGVAAVALLLSGRKTLKSKVPFGTFLTVGSLLALFYGQKILDWYLSYLGF